MSLEKEPTIVDAVGVVAISIGLVVCALDIFTSDSEIEPMTAETEFEIVRLMNDADCCLPQEVTEVVNGMCGSCEYILGLYDEKVEDR